jgi:hypothetical protein
VALLWRRSLAQVAEPAFGREDFVDGALLEAICRKRHWSRLSKTIVSFASP